MTQFRMLVNLGIVLLTVGSVCGDMLTTACEAEREGRYEEALDQYAAAFAVNPRLRDAERGIENVLREGLPLWIRERYLDRLPMDQTPVFTRVEESRSLPSVEMTGNVVIPNECEESRRRSLPSVEMTTQVEMTDHWPQKVIILTHKTHVAPKPTPVQTKTKLAYEHCAGAYELRDGKYRLAVVARWTEKIPQSRALAALRIFALCKVAAADMDIVRTYYDPSLAETRYRGLSILWLSPSGTPGGETIGRSAWLSGMGGVLAPEDLVRIVTHEAGHALIPPISGYVKPEETAEGYLGEILFTRYLAEQGISILADSEADTALRAAISGKAQRLMDVYRAHTTTGDPDDGLDGMRILIGGVLTLVDERGSGVLAKRLGARGVGRIALWKRVSEALADRAPGQAGEENSPSGSR